MEIIHADRPCLSIRVIDNDIYRRIYYCPVINANITPRRIKSALRS